MSKCYVIEDPEGVLARNRQNPKFYSVADVDSPCIGFIGAGKIAQAIAIGLRRNGMNNKNMWASAPTFNNLFNFKDMGMNVTNENEELVSKCSIVILCVKPFKAESVLQDLMKQNCWKNHLIISVISGLTIKTIESFCPPSARVIRGMPNTPIAEEAGVFVFSRGSNSTPKDIAVVHNLFGSLGLCKEIEENLINPVCGLTGSGPAYIYTVIQAMSDGGVKMGLPRDLSTELAAQTVMGAAKMVLGTRKHPAVLCDEVCSPAGTTIHGLHALEKGGVRAALIDAVEAATSRAIQQSQK